jgi:hypothetical protein
MLCDINQKKIFRIDKKIDFFSYGNSIFIADKKQFETALNFREGKHTYMNLTNHYNHLFFRGY